MRALKPAAAAFFAAIVVVARAPQMLAAATSFDLGVCNFTTTNVAFAAYDPTSATPATGSGNVTIDCSFPVALTLALSAGSAASFAPRSMPPVAAGTSPSLNYNLYTPGGAVWGDGTAGTSTVANTFWILGTTSVAIAGTIPIHDNVKATSFSDTITLTIAF